MSLMMLWLVTGLITILLFTVTDQSLSNIENNLTRRFSIVLSTVVCYPMFLLLALADQFIQFVSGEIGFEKAVSELLKEATTSIYRDLKEVW